MQTNIGQNMKNKTHQSKQLLTKAFRELPSSNSLNGVRSHIQRALNEIVKIEKTKAKKASQSQQTPRDKWELDLATGSMVNPLSPQMATNAVNAIEHMISQEQSKIQQKKSPNNNNNDVDTLYG